MAYDVWGRTIPVEESPYKQRAIISGRGVYGIHVRERPQPAEPVPQPVAPIVDVGKAVPVAPPKGPPSTMAPTTQPVNVLAALGQAPSATPTATTPREPLRGYTAWMEAAKPTEKPTGATIEIPRVPMPAPEPSGEVIGPRVPIDWMRVKEPGFAPVITPEEARPLAMTPSAEDRRLAAEKAAADRAAAEAAAAAPPKAAEVSKVPISAMKEYPRTMLAKGAEAGKPGFVEALTSLGEEREAKAEAATAKLRAAEEYKILQEKRRAATEQIRLAKENLSGVEKAITEGRMTKDSPEAKLAIRAVNESVQILHSLRTGPEGPPALQRTLVGLGAKPGVAEHIWNTVNNVFFGKMTAGEVDPRFSPVIPGVHVENPNLRVTMVQPESGRPTVETIDDGIDRMVRVHGLNRDQATSAAINFFQVNSQYPAYRDALRAWAEKHPGHAEELRNLPGSNPEPQVAPLAAPAPAPVPGPAVVGTPPVAAPTPAVPVAPAPAAPAAPAAQAPAPAAPAAPAITLPAAAPAAPKAIPTPPGAGRMSWEEVHQSTKPGDTLTSGGRTYEKDSGGNLIDLTEVDDAMAEPQDFTARGEVPKEWYKRAAGAHDNNPGSQTVMKLYEGVYDKGLDLDSPEVRDLWRQLTPEQKILVADIWLRTGVLSAATEESQRKTKKGL